MSDHEQVTLDGEEATRYVAVRRGDLDKARSVVQRAARMAADGDLDADPEALANLALRLAEAQGRDDLDGEQVAEFGGATSDE